MGNKCITKVWLRPLVKGPLERRKWVIILKMSLEEISYEDINSIELAEDRVQRLNSL
jgi:hypothetical protein